ncbi:MAG: diguanylate cyclase/phosphodiesterase with sensor(s) [Ilumatobacteraceae bacterium]|nr:diguanylate cyclase/phosphodiesterase with sensor(s) [Ilumatobacteraceae bacterium]
MVIDHCRAHAPVIEPEDLLALAGETRPLEVLTNDAGWSSYHEFRRFLEAAAVLLGGVERLRDVGTHAALAAGSMPEATGALQDLGSPEALFELVGAGQNSILPVLETATEQIDTNDWAIRSRLKDGLEPFPELCAFIVGLDMLLPALFGFAGVTTEEETCVCNGDDWCTVRVRWPETDATSRQLAVLETKVQLSELRLEAFQRILGELVSADDLSTMLSRVVESAAHAVRASGFVLALEPLSWSGRHVYGKGITDDEAITIACEVLLLDDPDEWTGGIAVDIASTRQNYGRLVALDSTGSLMPHERNLLEAYARIVATAMDSATALEEARRQARTAHTLLNLSTALAQIATTDEMAAKIAQAIPIVVDCDRALVVLLDTAAGEARVVASQGFGPSVTGARVPMLGDGLFGRLRFYDVRDAREPLRTFMRQTGMSAMVSVPVMVDDVTVGSLVAAVTDRPERLAPSIELEERLRGLAGQGSTALRNAALVEQISHQAMHDSLTGLPNRTLILDRAEQMLARSQRGHTPCAALYIDIDGFKDVNDMFGHAAGDELLCAVATRLTSSTRASDTVGRLGGDEFVVLTEGDSLDAGPECVAERLLSVLREPYRLSDVAHPVQVTASIGIAEGHRGSASDLLRDADLALYRGKADGKNRYVTFAAEMQTALVDRLQLEGSLRRALAADEFFVLYQPIFDLDDQRITGAEALLRWRRADGSVVMPDAFIPLLEESGMIVEVGRWVLHAACQQAARWARSGCRLDISVNLSARQLDQESLIDDVIEALRSSGLSSDALTLEITETAVMRDPARTLRILSAIQDLGVRIAIDDFGTGYSSLAYLQQFPIDTIKIDRSFIQGISTSDESKALIRTLVQLGKTLGLRTLAEGIESCEQLAVLRGEHCDSGQGYLIARPLEAAKLELLLAEQSPSLAAS